MLNPQFIQSSLAGNFKLICTTLSATALCSKLLNHHLTSPSQRRNMSACTIPVTHQKCRNATLTGTDVKRFTVPDDKVSWSVVFPEYKPVQFTLPLILKDKPVWADLEDTKDIKFNEVETKLKLNRVSFMGPYKIVDGVPQNPVGRTGIAGRGHLGRWGPNHAADPIVTRWKRDKDGKTKVVNDKTSKPILEFVSILRGDTKEWAIPGGMVDAGEDVSLTLKREFSEEALNSIQATDAERKVLAKKVDEAFCHGKEVYRGYVDDPRNTDNAWMETVAMNFHDDTGDSLAKFSLTAGDDAVGVKWTEINSGLKLYASHINFVKHAAEMNGAHW